MNGSRATLKKLQKYLKVNTITQELPTTELAILITTK